MRIVIEKGRAGNIDFHSFALEKYYKLFLSLEALFDVRFNPQL